MNPSIDTSALSFQFIATDPESPIDMFYLTQFIVPFLQSENKTKYDISDNNPLWKFQQVEGKKEEGSLWGYTHTFWFTDFKGAYL